MIDWLSRNEEWLAILGGISVVAFVASLILVPLVVISLPSDFFTRPGRAMPRTPLRLALHALKNVLGGCFVLAGIVMLVLPGQGILALLLGFSLIDFPAKRRIQLKLISRPHVYRSIAWIRHKANRPDLEIPGGVNKD